MEQPIALRSQVMLAASLNKLAVAQGNPGLLKFMVVM